MKGRIQLVHWDAAAAAERARLLRAGGYEVDCRAASPQLFRELRDRPPAAFVIDLSRSPSQGRDVALGLRAQRGTKAVPIVFVDGDPEKIARIKTLLPDAVYASRRDVDRLAEAGVAARERCHAAGRARCRPGSRPG